MTTCEQRMKDERIKKLLDSLDEFGLAERIIELEQMLEERTLQHKTQHDNALRLLFENEKLRGLLSPACVLLEQMEGAIAICATLLQQNEAMSNWSEVSQRIRSEFKEMQ